MKSQMIPATGGATPKVHKMAERYKAMPRIFWLASTARKRERDRTRKVTPREKIKE